MRGSIRLIHKRGLFGEHWLISKAKAAINIKLSEAKKLIVKNLSKRQRDGSDIIKQ